MRSLRSRALQAFFALALVLILPGCRPGARPSHIIASGHVEATEVRVSTKVPGRLVAFPLREGDRVGVGDPLARIDTTDLELALRQARADLEQAQAELHLRRAGARKEDIAELAAQAAAAEAEQAGAERDLVRMQALLERGSGTAKAADDARTRRDVLAARLAASREALARARAGSRPEEIEAAEARVAACEARVALYDQQIRDAAVASPVRGVVTEKTAEEGELLAAGARLAVVTDLEDAWLTVYVGEPDLGKIRLGQEVEVVTDDGQTRTGKITFVSSEAEFTPKNVQTRDERVKLVFKLKVGLDNRDGLFKPGMPAEARFPAS